MRAHVCRLSRVPFKTGPCTNPHVAQSDVSSIQVRSNVYESDDDDNHEGIQPIPVINQATSSGSEEIPPAVDVYAPAFEQALSGDDSQSSHHEAIAANSEEDAITGFDVSRARVGQRLSGVHIDSGELVTGKIVSRAGKKNWKIQKLLRHQEGR